jgi:hypothetical protein
MTTFADFFTRASRELEDAAQTQFVAPSLLAWGNDAFTDIALKSRNLQDEQSATSVAEQESYTLPSYTTDTLSVAYDGRMLPRYNRDDYLKLSVSATGHGAPSKWMMYADSLYLHPKPDATGKKIRYFRTYSPTPAASVTATSTTPFSSRFDDLALAFIKWHAYEQIQDLEQANYHHSVYEAKLDDARMAKAGASGAGGVREVY